MTKPARHLYAVDNHVADENGEVIPPHRLLAELEQTHVDLKMAQRDVKAKNRRINELERDRARERLEHPDRALIERVLRYWHRKCRAGSPRVNPLSPERFDAVAALVEMEHVLLGSDGKRRRERRYTPEDFKAAVDGAHLDHYVAKRKNGTEQHFDDAELVFRTVAKFEEFMARDPRRKPPGPLIRQPRKRAELFVADWA